MSVTVGAVVLAGGAARRMGGVDKLAIAVGESTLLDRVLSAARPLCHRLVVVGPRRPTSVPGVEFTLERDRAGGPVPAVLAGAGILAGEIDVALVLAGDLPLVTTAALARLVAFLESATETHAAAALDERGTPNPLFAAYRAPVLEAAAGRALGEGDRAARLLPAATSVVDLGGEATLNVNRPADLRRARRLLTAARGG